MARYKAAVALKPDLSVAHLRLGELYQSRGLCVEAAAAFRAAASSAKGTARARIGEARALEASGAFNEALAAMRAIVETHPESVEARTFLGKLLGEAGLTAEAAANYERVTELFPEMGAAWTGIALNKKFTADDGVLINRMNAALTHPKTTPRDRKALHFALGKAHDDLGDYDEAMRNFEAGNRLRASNGGLKRDALVRRVDQLIAATPSGYRDRQPDRGVEDSTPILIAGMPRSGTTLTEQIFSSQPEVKAGGELGFWATRDTPGNVWSLTATAGATRRLANDYLTTLRALEPDAKPVTDKGLANFMLLGFIHRVFPNATLISLPASSDRHRSFDLHHKLRDELRLRLGSERSRLSGLAAHGPQWAGHVALILSKLQPVADFFLRSLLRSCCKSGSHEAEAKS